MLQILVGEIKVVQCKSTWRGFLEHFNWFPQKFAHFLFSLCRVCFVCCGVINPSHSLNLIKFFEKIIKSPHDLGDSPLTQATSLQNVFCGDG